MTCVYLNDFAFCYRIIKIALNEHVDERLTEETAGKLVSPSAFACVSSHLFDLTQVFQAVMIDGSIL